MYNKFLNVLLFCKLHVNEHETLLIIKARIAFSCHIHSTLKYKTRNTLTRLFGFNGGTEKKING